MADILLSYLLPAVLVGFYVGLNWPNVKENRGLQLIVGGGTFLYYAGLVCNNWNPAVGSLFRLAGSLILLALILYQVIKRRR